MRQKNVPSLQTFSYLFNDLLSEQVSSEIFNAHGPAKRRPPQVQARELVKAMVFQCLRDGGTLSQTLELSSGTRISDAAIAQRRKCMGFEPFYWMLEGALQTKAQAEQHPEAFYRGKRLLGIDGTEGSVTNTPQVLGMMTKANTRRFKAAYAKVRMCVVVELGLRNPIAAGIGTKGESESELGKELLEKLPEDGLLLGDRHYGCRPVIGKLDGLGRDYLLRVKSNMKCKVVETLGDGSAVVELETEDGKVKLREVNGRVKRPGGKWVEVRLWTSLKEWEKYPAQELVELYSRRWEQESFYRELKVEMRSSAVIRSHTAETAAQELAAWILAHAVLVKARMEAAKKGKVEVLKISFGKTLGLMVPLWQVIEGCAEILKPEQIREMTERTMEMLAGWVVPERRKRSCPRAVRQPVSSWPRLVNNTYQTGPTECEVIPVTI